MNTHYECRVISLANQPAKYAQFLERNRPTGLDFRLFSAVDGKRLTPEECVRNGLIRQGARGYTPGAIGCGASHLALWKEAVAINTNLLIFEDDVVCRHDIAPRLGSLFADLRDWDMILLGCNTNAVLDVQVAEGIDFGGFFSNPAPSLDQLERFARTVAPVTAVRLNNAFGNCAYLVSPSGAKKLMPVFPMDNRPVFIPANKMKHGRDTFACTTKDMLMNSIYRNINAYIVMPLLAIPPNDQATSTTRQTGAG